MMPILHMRCPWCSEDPLYIKYHDEEWGRPVTDDIKLFECLVLESAQAGLSWLSVLRRREGYREAFYGFDLDRIATMTDKDVERLMAHKGIIRNRRKIEATISNAIYFKEIQVEYGSFYSYLRSFFTRDLPIVNYPKSLSDVAVTSPESEAISKDMRRRGFRFFGSIICYAFLQATGFVNDHLDNCQFKYPVF
ncbi:MAG: DNA-3-methyladenine glycosylase I [Odoribacter sp.]|nr:DNA-3-methyladenine glycosylase I [Odoribacter sp.]